MKMRMLGVAMIVLMSALVPPVLAEEGKSGTTNMDILIEKVKADKKLIVAANMNLTDAEGKAFWPLYDAYQKDLAAINERLAKAITAYAEAYAQGPVPNDTAKKAFNEALAAEEAEVKLKQSYLPKLEKALAAEEAEVKLKQSYLPKLEKALSASKAVRYLQIENKIRAAIRYELADQIPLTD